MEKRARLLLLLGVLSGVVIGPVVWRAHRSEAVTGEPASNSVGVPDSMIDPSDLPIADDIEASESADRQDEAGGDPPPPDPETTETLEGEGGAEREGPVVVA